MIPMRILLGCMLLLVGLTGCGGVAGEEREQIERVVANYLVLDPAAPQYDITVDEVSGDWARVSVVEAGVEAEPMIIYVARQSADVSTPTAAQQVLPGGQAVVGEEGTAMEVAPGSGNEPPGDPNMGMGQGTSERGGVSGAEDAAPVGAGRPPSLPTTAPETISGWVVVLGPAIDFPPEQLEQAGVPEALHD